jgi:hypothetical protein
VSYRKFGILLIVLLASALTVFAQEVPPPNATQEAQPTAIVMTAIPPASPTIEAAATATAEGAQAGEDLPILISARSDLQLLAINTLGNNLPAGWNDSLDINDPQLPLLIRLDLELLAGALLGADKRPPGWFGTVLSTPSAIARDIRHDLELLADTVSPGPRPFGWAGDDPVMRCNRSTQSLLALLEHNNGFQVEVDFSSPDYCDQIAVKASQFVEIYLLNQGTQAAPVASQPGGPAGTLNIQITGNFAVAFFDRNARRRAGIIPNGATVQAVARSTAEFSKMTVVQGDGYQVFLDYSNTTLTADQFATLPDVNGMELNPTCIADWCGS